MVEYTGASTKPSASDFTMVVEKTMVMVQNASMVVAMVQTASTVADAVQTTIEAVVVLPVVVAAVTTPFDGLLPSHSTCPLFCPRVNHMRDNPYLHAE